MNVFKRLFSRIVKSVPIISLQHPKCLSETSVSVKGTDILTFLRREQRQKLNEDGRWSFFDKNSAERATAGSIIKVTYYQSKTDTRPSTFTGILIAIRRHPSEPTFSLRTIIDRIGVEQLFPVFSPLISKIEIVKRAIKIKSNKAYWLRDKPEKASEFITKKSKKKIHKN